MVNKRFKAKNIIRKRLNQKGFTLTEVIISIAITVIIATTAIFVTQAILRTSTLSSDTTDQGTIYNATLEYIIEELRYSTDIKIGGTKPDTTYNTISINTDGLLTVNNEVFPYTEFFYLDNKLSGIPREGGGGTAPIFKVVDETTIEIGLRITSRNDNHFEEKRTIKLINMEINDTVIVEPEGTESNIVHYK